MKRQRWVITVLISVLFIIGWAVRFHSVNQQAGLRLAKIEYFPMHEKVDLGHNFFYRESENRFGYSVKVNDAKLYPYADYVDELQLTVVPDEYSDYVPDYVYDLEVTVSVDVNDDGGMDMFNTKLISDSLGMRISKPLWDALYPQLGGSYSFRLVNNSEMEMHFPYVLETVQDQSVIDKNALMRRSFYLSLSEYPVKKRINIGPLQE